MKKLFAAAMAVAMMLSVTVVLLLPTFAVASEYVLGKPYVDGTITAWDDATKQGTITDADGKRIAFTWDAKTTIAGTPKVGEHASIAYTADKTGKNWATHVRILAKPASAKPSTSQ